MRWMSRGAAALATLASGSALEVGDVAPGLGLPGSDGKVHSLAEHRDKVGHRGGAPGARRLRRDQADPDEQDDDRTRCEPARGVPDRAGRAIVLPGPTRLLALALAVGGCSNAARLELLAPEGWVSALVAIDDTSGRALLAHDGPSALVLQHPEGQDVDVVALFYRQPLSQLSLVAGAIELSGTAERPAPASDLDGAARAIVGGDLGAQEIVGASDVRRDRVRLPFLTDAGCALDGRCMERTNIDATCIERCAVSGEVDVEPPRPPAPPLLTPCAMGWTEIDAECVPPSLPPRATCAPGEVQHFGASICAPIGHACPAGEWPAAIPSGVPLRFVHPARAVGPGGEASFATIADALVNAPDDTVVLLSRGEHAGGFVLAGPTIIGACARDTVIQLPSRLRITSGRLEDLTVRGGTADDAAIDVAAGGRGSLAGIVIETAGVVSFGQLEADDVLLRDMTARAIWIDGAGSADLSRIVIERGGSESILSNGAGARIDVRGLVVTSPTETSVAVYAGAALHVAGAHLLGAYLKAERSASLEMEDVFASDGGSPDINVIEARSGSTVVARRVSIDRPVLRAIDVSGARLSFEDGWIRDGGETDDRTLIDVTDGATLTLSRSTISDFDLRAIGVYEAGTSASLADLHIRSARGFERRGAIGVAVDRGRLTAARLSMRDLSGSAIRVVQSGTATVTDLRLDHVVRAVPLDASDGLSARQGGRLTIRRADVRQVHGSAVVAEDGQVWLEDLRAIGPSEDMLGGTGIDVVREGSLIGQRMWISGGSGAGLRVAEASRASLSDLRIDDVVRIGLTVNQSQCDVVRFVIARVGSRGLDVRESSQVDVRDGTITAITPHETDRGYGARVVNGSRLRMSGVAVTEAADAAIFLEFIAGFVSELPFVELEDVTLARSGFGVRTSISVGREAAPNFTRVRFIGNVVDVVAN